MEPLEEPRACGLTAFLLLIVAERRMGRRVLDLLAADIDPAAVADAVEIVLTGQQREVVPAGRRYEERASTWASAGDQLSCKVPPRRRTSGAPPPMRARSGSPCVLPIARMESP